ncbi:MAG: acyltransferase [Syntrophales bacterium]|nr:acyltransferase [Syntrophales bacterium]HPL62309.1 acyltransferase [Syntrophales bacterium]
MIENLLFRIRKSEKPGYARLKKILTAAMFFDRIECRPLFRAVYESLVVLRFLLPFLREKLFSIPVFKSRCGKCGRGVSLPNGIPWIEGNLRIEIGEKVMLDGSIILSGRVYDNPLLRIGDRTVLGFKTSVNVACSVVIGSDCLIAGGCLISDNDGHPLNPERRLRREVLTRDEVKPIVIEDNVWIGTHSVILKGVRIGAGSVISANSVVTRNIPPYSIAMGAPARILLTGTDRIFRKPPDEKTGNTAG